MAPALENGDYVLTFTTQLLWPKHFQIGKIYIINHIDLGRIIKRLEQELPNGRLMFCGDSPASNSRNILGEIEKTRVNARVWFRISSKKSGFI